MRLHALLLSAALGSAACAAPDLPAPGDRFEPPARPAAAGAPLIFEHSRAAGPDETFLCVGADLTTNLSVWGESAQSPTGQEWKPHVQFLTNGLLAATLPQKAQDGLFLVWAKNACGWSAPVVLNAPQPWWCSPARARQAHTGRDLQRGGHVEGPGGQPHGTAAVRGERREGRLDFCAPGGEQGGFFR